MIWVYVIFAAVGFVWAFGSCMVDTDDIPWSFFMGLIGASFGCLLVWGTNGFIEADEASRATNYKTTYVLHEMQLNNESENHSVGGFFLIAGGTSSSFTKHGYYYFYAEAPSGDITIGKMRIEDAVINQGDGSPRLVCKTHKKNQRFDADDLDYHIENCVFHVPEGSIGDKINIRLKGNI